MNAKCARFKHSRERKCGFSPEIYENCEKGQTGESEVAGGERREQSGAFRLHRSLTTARAPHRISGPGIPQRPLAPPTPHEHPQASTAGPVSPHRSSLNDRPLSSVAPRPISPPPFDQQPQAGQRSGRAVCIQHVSQSKNEDKTAHTTEHRRDRMSPIWLFEQPGGLLHPRVCIMFVGSTSSTSQISDIQSLACPLLAVCHLSQHHKHCSRYPSRQHLSPCPVKHTHLAKSNPTFIHARGATEWE